MAKFVLTEETQLIREMEVHAAAKDMASRLGITGQIETRVGDFRQKGNSTGWAGKPSPHDVLLEVYVVPMGALTLSMETENLVLRAALNRIAGEGAADDAIEAHRNVLREHDALLQKSRTNREMENQSEN